ncbi:Ig-like domain-containing protein [Staphylococcus aureus]
MTVDDKVKSGDYFTIKYSDTSEVYEIRKILKILVILKIK